MMPYSQYHWKQDTLTKLPKTVTLNGKTSSGSGFFFFPSAVNAFDLCVWGCELAHDRGSLSPPTSPSSLHLLLSQTQWTSGDFEGTINIPTVFSISWRFWDLVITDWGGGQEMDQLGR